MTPSDLLPLEIQLLQNLRRANATANLMVAFSGGMDSKVLLHALVRLRDAELVNNIGVAHVNHGLQKVADQWEQRCRIDCEKYQVKLVTIQLRLSESRQNNIEATAREGRYRFFESIIQPGQYLLMAHHQNDQAETLLFRLLRGCGLHGAAAMPQSRRLGKGKLLRPLLGVIQSDIADYAKVQQLQWLEDSSNQNEAFSRNFLRHQIMTRIKQKWPGYLQTLSRFAQMADEQSQLLDEVAEQDLLQVSTGKSTNCDIINIAKLSLLSDVRKKNLLHYWGKINTQIAPSSGEISELLKQLPAAQKQSIKLNFGLMLARSYQGQLLLSSKVEPLPLVEKVCWQNIEQLLELPDGMSLMATRTLNTEAGIRLPKKNEVVWVAGRTGGERCLPEYREKSTQLKKIYQELLVPPWQRKWLPLVYYNQKIVAVPGYFIDKAFIAEKTEESFNLSIMRSQKATTD